jgi:hypothetical protein
MNLVILYKYRHLDLSTPEIYFAIEKQIVNSVNTLFIWNNHISGKTKPKENIFMYPWFVSIHKNIANLAITSTFQKKLRFHLVDINWIIYIMYLMVKHFTLSLSRSLIWRTGQSVCFLLISINMFEVALHNG